MIMNVLKTRSIILIYKHFFDFATVYTASLKHIPFPADNFSKNSTKVILNKECILLTHAQFIRTVYFESNLIRLQPYFARYDMFISC